MSRDWNEVEAAMQTSTRTKSGIVPWGRGVIQSYMEHKGITEISVSKATSLVNAVYQKEGMLGTPADPDKKISNSTVRSMGSKEPFKLVKKDDVVTIVLTKGRRAK